MSNNSRCRSSPSLVRLVGRCLLLQLHDGVLWVHFHGLLGDHVRSHGIVTKGLRLHDTCASLRPEPYNSNLTYT